MRSLYTEVSNVPHVTRGRVSRVFVLIDVIIPIELLRFLLLFGQGIFQCLILSFKDIVFPQSGNVHTDITYHNIEYQNKQIVAV